MQSEARRSGEPQTGKPIRGFPPRPPSPAAPPCASHAPIRPAALRLVPATALLFLKQRTARQRPGAGDGGPPVDMLLLAQPLIDIERAAAGEGLSDSGFPSAPNELSHQALSRVLKLE
ncbi:unnamed protein product [Pleuronectes platessa]|uniref:Uncharacterized protein n=1 Tax=Pleuronectes platessa TaxID=8262 RepID=A0A9N7YJP0_PLEPL|nr:unnamed protein product [Pleuronectes platessa]